MKCWFQTDARRMARGLWWLFAAQISFAQKRIVPEKPATGTQVRLYCTNESGELRCIWENREMSASKPVPPQPQPAVSSVPQEAQIEQAPRKDQQHFEEIFVGVNVNGRLVDDFARILHVGSGQFYATADQFARWRLKLPQFNGVWVGERNYYQLQVQGVMCRLDLEQQVLFVLAPASSFTETVFDLSARSAVEAMIPAVGAFLNHDFELSRANGMTALSGLLELGFFSRVGVLTTRLVGRDIAQSPVPLRLDTQFVRDFPRRMATLTIGDAVSAPAPWALQVHYGGIRWASKFSTQPTFVPFPVPVLTGQATQPSTIDIYVDNVRTANQTVDTGPFSVRNLPVMTGQGEIRMVVTDVLGRQQVITEPYINARVLLRKGVSEYAYESGSLRGDFGTSNAAYGSFFLVGTHRRGLTDSLTLNLRGDVLADHQTFGIGADYALLPVGLISGGLAVSQAAHGPGRLVYGQFQHQSRSIVYSAMIQAASGEFRQLGLPAGERPARTIEQIQVGRALGNRGFVSFGFLNRQHRTGLTRSESNQSELDFRAFTGSLNLRLTDRVSLSVSSNYSPGLKRGLNAFISLVMPLGPRRILVASSDLEERANTSMIDLTQQPPVGNGYGYRVRVNQSLTPGTEAGLWFQSNRGNYRMETSDKDNKLSWRFGETGSVVWMGRHILLSRPLDDSFALVEVPKAKGVKVFSNNQFITTTNGRGIALIPNLVPYDRNTVRLDDSSVPFNLGVDFSEKTVVPMPRSGVQLKFAASEIEGGLLVLVTEDGGFVPLGAEVTINDYPEVFQVALRGEVFVPNFSVPAHIQVRWPISQCDATVTNIPGNEPLPRIGPITCKAHQ